ncbi:MAG TPA: phosphoglycerate dehydrogenase [Gemmatimonadaceae bacterium]|jgi:D-3-phosphoglycerate dehydrogenase|nr:phosphoglycerate dehydrogenase [Gemmatimonadaceae bacterium]
MTAMYRVLVADQISLDGLAPLRDDSRFELVVRPGLKGTDLADAIAEADAVLVRSATQITRESLARANGLKVIGRAGVGVDTIDVDAATERGIAVLTAPAGNTISAAELTLALMLALLRRVPAADRSMKAGQWDRKSFSGTELYGKTLGLVGAGRIGGEVAKRARAFGMTVIAYDPFLIAERAQALGIERAELEDVLRRADVVSLHVPLTEATAGLVGDRELALMKPSAVIVNAARGGVVSEDAIARAIREKRIAGAALDVFEQEPLPADHPLRTLDNVVLTPHLGASTAEAQQNVAIEIAEAVRAALVDGDLARAVNAPGLGGEEMRRLRPLLELAERLGILTAALADGGIARVEVRYSGAATNGLRLLTATVLCGALSRVVGASAVNTVNALHVAAAHGIRVDQIQLDSRGSFAEQLEIRATTDAGETRVAGALIGDSHARIVLIDDFRVDMVPRGTLLVLRNQDAPGVIGHVGTVLGHSGINIGYYHQSRLDVGGDALAIVSIDGRVEPSVLEALAALPEIRSVRQVHLDRV